MITFFIILSIVSLFSYLYIRRIKFFFKPKVKEKKDWTSDWIVNPKDVSINRIKAINNYTEWLKKQPVVTKEEKKEETKYYNTTTDSSNTVLDNFWIFFNGGIF